MVTIEEIFEIGRSVDALLDGLEVSFTENGFVLREKGSDPLFSKRVDVTMETYSDGNEFAAVGFYGESGGGKGGPAVVSLLPDDSYEVRAFLRFAIGSAFNMELKPSFMEG